MKRLFVVALATLTLSSLTVLHAQSDAAPAAPSAAANEKKDGPKFDRTQQLQKQLNLTDEQTAKVKELQEWQREESKKLGKEATKEQRQALRKQYGEKLNAILTPEQQTQLEKIHKEQGQKLREGKEKKKLQTGS